MGRRGRREYPRSDAVTAEQHLLSVFAEVLATADLRQSSRQKIRSGRGAEFLARRARELIHENLHEPLRMVDLCDSLNCKQRTLHHAFGKYFGASPSAYHKNIRLNAARSTLLAADSETTSVTQTAIDFGFWHLGRFSVDYRQLFSESPSETLARRVGGSGRRVLVGQLRKVG